MTTAREIAQYYKDWFAEPLVLSMTSVADVLCSIHKHSLSKDATGCDFFYPLNRARKAKGRFYIYGECQEVWSFFVLKGTETMPNPPVYLHSSLDLSIDHGYRDSDIIDGDYALVGKFRDFLWDALAHQVLARIETPETLASDVIGITWYGTEIDLDSSFETRAELPGGATCYTSNSAIASPNYGAVFRDLDSLTSFINSYPKLLTRKWDRTKR